MVNWLNVFLQEQMKSNWMGSQVLWEPVTFLLSFVSFQILFVLHILRNDFTKSGTPESDKIHFSDFTQKDSW